MRKAAGSSRGDSQKLKEIGEILSLGVHLLLNQQHSELDTHPEPTLPSDLPELSGDEVEAIFQFIRNHRKVSIGEIMNYTGLSRSTARRRVDLLVDAKKIQRKGKGRGAIYTVSNASAET